MPSGRADSMRFANRPFSGALSLYAVVSALPPQQELLELAVSESGPADSACFLDSTVLCHILCGPADDMWYADNTFGNTYHPKHATKLWPPQLAAVMSRKETMSRP